MNEQQTAWLATAVARMKSEIVADVKTRVINPALVSTFSDLHNFVDANEYGGFCDDDVLAAMLPLFPRVADDDAECMPGAFSDAFNAAQNEINEWLDAGAGLTVGQVVRFSQPMDESESTVTFDVLEIRGPRVLVAERDSGMSIAPTNVYQGLELERV